MKQVHDLQSLAARQEIQDVLVAYCAHLDRMDLPALGALFTPTCRVIYADDPRFTAEGRDDLVRSLARMWRWQRTAHHISNVLIRVGPDGQATSESSVMAWHEAPGGDTATVFGRYLDEFQLTPEGWKIAVRRMEMNGADAGFKVPLPQARREPPPEGWTIEEWQDLG